ncbi:hypothetical protein J6590_054674 [Homalodisca vitripennis]|nr:hypothetical protein J6590_054674 [Homalodisca vitripennis]
MEKSCKIRSNTNQKKSVISVISKPSETLKKRFVESELRGFDLIVKTDLVRETNNKYGRQAVNEVVRPSVLAMRVARTNYSKPNMSCLQPWFGQCCWPFGRKGLKNYLTAVGYNVLPSHN